ncbi:MAG: hypothetical protein ACRCY3_12465 [Sphingorhabdus sp.]
MSQAVADRLDCALRSDEGHAGFADAVADAAIMGLVDFAVYAQANAGCCNVYHRGLTEGETIVTSSIGIELASQASIGALVIARGGIFYRTNRAIHIHGVLLEGVRPIGLYTGVMKRAPLNGSGKLTVSCAQVDHESEDSGPISLGPHFDRLARVAVLGSALQARVEERHCNSLGICHGGFLLSLADALGQYRTPNSHLGSMHVNYLGPAIEADVLAGSIALESACANEVMCSGTIASTAGIRMTFVQKRSAV